MYTDQGYIFPRLNSAAAAALNVAGIQAALNIGGTVRLVGSGVVYINGPLLINSNTKLILDPTITIRQAPNTNNILLQNAAYLSAFSNVTSVVQVASRLQATVVWPTHGQVVGNYVWLQGQPGIAATVTLTIASPGVVNWTAHGLLTGQQIVFATTGALPTGIVAKQIYYVSASNNTANAFQLSSSYVNAVAGVNINFTGTQSGVQSAQVVPDSAYTGNFMVSSVTDANTIVVDLYRMPNVAAAGVFSIKQCDQNIAIEGGLWDYDYNNNTMAAIPPGGNAEHIISLAGIQGFTARNMTGTNAPKFFFNTWALRDYKFENIGSTIGNSGKAASDVVHLYGPSFAGIVDRISITPGIDDGITLHAANPAFYAQFNPPGGLSAYGGDVLDVHVSHVDFAEGATGAVVIYSVPGFLMDGLNIEKVASRQTGSMIRFDQSSRAVGGNDPPGSAQLGSIKVKDVRWGETLSTDAVLILGQQNIDRFEVDGIIGTFAGTASSVRSAIKVDSSGAGGGPINITQMIARGLDINAFNSFYGVFLVSGSTTVTTLKLADSVLLSNGIGSSDGINIVGSAIVNNLIVDNVYAKKLSAVVLTASVGSVTLANNVLDQCFAVLSSSGIVGTINARFGKNTILGGASYPNGGLARISGASTIANIYSDGDNVGVGAGLWMLPFSAPTVNLFAEDFAVDVTTVARVDGGKLYNTNAAAGTLGVAGKVDGSGAAANSWHLRVNPTLVY